MVRKTMLIWDKYDKTYREVIDVNVIKEKIKELEKEKEEYITTEWEMEDLIEAQIRILQELLEEEN